MKRTLRAATAFLALAVLTACSAPGAGAGQYDDGIRNDLPAALLGSDLGIAEVDASRSQSGFAFHLTVALTVERDVVTTDELRTLLALIVENTTTDPDAFTVLRLNIGDARHKSAIGAPESIDLSSAAAELGLEPTSSTNDRDKFFPAYPWADVVALVQE